MPEAVTVRHTAISGQWSFPSFLSEHVKCMDTAQYCPQIAGTRCFRNYTIKIRLHLIAIAQFATRRSVTLYNINHRTVVLTVCGHWRQRLNWCATGRSI